MNRELNGIFNALREGREGSREALIEMTYQDLIQWGSHLRGRLRECPLMEVEDLVARVFIALRTKRVWDFDSLDRYRAWALVQMDRASKDAYRRENCRKRGGPWPHLSLDDAYLGEI